MVKQFYISVTKGIPVVSRFEVGFNFGAFFSRALETGILHTPVRKGKLNIVLVLKLHYPLNENNSPYVLFNLGSAFIFSESKYTSNLLYLGLKMTCFD